jgi:hypothetical protein
MPADHSFFVLNLKQKRCLWAFQNINAVGTEYGGMPRSAGRAGDAEALRWPSTCGVH